MCALLLLGGGFRQTSYNIICSSFISSFDIEFINVLLQQQQRSNSTNSSNSNECIHTIYHPL